MAGHARSHRVQLNVTVAGEYVVFGPREPGTEAAYPQRAGAVMGAVDVLHVTLPQVFQQQGSTVSLFWRE